MVSGSDDGSNWGIGFAALVATIFIAFGLGSYAVSLGYGHYEKQCPEAAANRSRTEQYCPQQVDTDISGLPYLAQSIASNPEPKDSQERERRDLAAQESMSVWAFWMMAVSMVGVVVTMVGTGFLLWQIMLTREAVVDTGEATKAMRKANKIAKIFSRQQLQANISLSDVTHETRLNEKIYVKLRVTNDGQTPAINFRGAARITIRKTDDIPAHESVDFTKYAPNIVGAGCPSTFHGRTEYPIEPQVLIGLENGDYSIFCDGIISYEDIFQNNFIVTFQMISDDPVKQGTFSPTGDGIRIEKMEKQEKK